MSFLIFKKTSRKVISLLFFLSLLFGFFISPGSSADFNNQVFAANSVLSGRCFAVPSNVEVGKSMVWHADISGGQRAGSHFYYWSGSDELKGNSGSVRKTYNTPGLKTATVRVKSGSQQIFSNCSVNVIGASSDSRAVSQTGAVLGAVSSENLGSGSPPSIPVQSQTVAPESFFATCAGNPSPAGIGENVTWSVLAVGDLERYYQYLWSGSDGLLANSRALNKIYYSIGEKIANVVVISDGQSAQVTCAVNVVDQDGMVAGVSLERSEGGFTGQSLFWLFLAGGLFLAAIILIFLFFGVKKKVMKEESRFSLAYKPAEPEKDEQEAEKNGGNGDITAILEKEARKSNVIISVDALKALIEKSDNKIQKASENLKTILEFKKDLPCPIIEGEERCDVLTKSEVEKYFLKQGVLYDIEH